MQAASTWARSGRVRFWPNLRAAYGVFVLEKAVERRAPAELPATELPRSGRMGSHPGPIAQLVRAADS